MSESASQDAKGYPRWVGEQAGWYLRNMQSQDRRILLMSYADHLTAREIARVLNLEEQEVIQRLRIAGGQLRLRLQGLLAASNPTPGQGRQLGHGCPDSASA